MHFTQRAAYNRFMDFFIQVIAHPIFAVCLCLLLGAVAVSGKFSQSAANFLLLCLWIVGSSSLMRVPDNRLKIGAILMLGGFCLIISHWVRPQRKQPPAVNEQHGLPKSNVTQPSGFNYPAVDFILIPENVPGNAVLTHIPHLEVSIRNRGNYALKDMRMRPTMYQLDLRFKVLPRVEKLPENKVRIYPGKTEPAIKNFVRIGKDSVKIRSIAPGTKSKPVDLSTLKEFKFVKSPGPGEPGGPGGPPLQGVPVGESDTLRYYALRYSFIDDGTQKRYSFYQVISCQQPYLLPLDNPNMSIIGAGTDDDWLLRPSQLIIDHQHKIYGSYLEEEYRPSGSAMPQQ